MQIEIKHHTPRTDAFVDALPPVVLPNLTREGAVAIGTSVRNVVVAWDGFARGLEVENSRLRGALERMVNTATNMPDWYDMPSLDIARAALSAGAVSGRKEGE